MKLKRDEFKAMLKECILELVQEGKLFQGQAAANGGNRHGEQGAPQHEGTPNQQFLNEVNTTAANMARGIAKGDTKKNAMYHSIIADTAKTTLQTQRAAELGLSSGGGMMMEATVHPEDKVFDSAQLGVFQASNRWAQLAFGNKAKNPNGS